MVFTFWTVKKPRLSKLSYCGYKNLSRLPQRSAVIAFSLVDVYSSQEAFVTGTLGSLTQVLEIDGRSIGKVKNGWPITEKLRAFYKNLINE